MNCLPSLPSLRSCAVRAPVVPVTPATAVAPGTALATLMVLATLAGLAPASPVYAQTSPVTSPARHKGGRVERGATTPAARGELDSIPALPAASIPEVPDAGTVDSARLRRRSISALRITGNAPRIDGSLDDPLWRRAFADPRIRVDDFVEQRPQPGVVPSLPTIAAFAYDDEAVYVAVRAWDPAPDSIVAPYPRRDDETRSDWIFVELDTRHDRRSGFSLGVNPRGVQVDGTWDNDVNYDPSWNAVWQAATSVDSLGWTAEYRIPFSQLRASAPVSGQRDVVWGMNIYRHTVHRGSSSDWSPRLPSYGGRVVSHFNDLHGIELPRAQHRFELRPFVLGRSEPSTRIARAGNADAVAGAGAGVGALAVRDDRSSDISAGLDATVHLVPGLTLDATVNPDFGQVEADPSQINLTTFETFLQEQRPFFVNGADIFHFDLGVPFTTRDDDFTLEQAFYSRRIGAPPHGTPPATALASDLPLATDVLGALKLSGRVANHWTVGGMAAATRTASARYLDAAGNVDRMDVEPRALYGAVRLQRDFHDGASAAGLFASGVDRGSMSDGLESLLVKRALFLGADARHRIGNYEVSGFAGASRVTGSAASITGIMHGPGHFLQRPGASYAHDDTLATAATGAAARLRFARVDGGNLTWSITGYGITPRFDVDDQGFQHNADWLLALGTIRYERNEPREGGHLFRRWAIGSNQLGVGWSWGGERRATVLNLQLEGDLWNYWGGSLAVDQELGSLSLDLLRGGAAVKMPARTTLSLDMYSDTRRATQLQLNTSISREAGSGSSSLDIAPTIASRVTDRLALTGSVEYTRSTSGWQYLGVPLLGNGESRIVLARLRASTLSLTARADYAFSPHLTLQLYAQPYFGAGRYDRPKYALRSGSRATIVDLGSRTSRLDDGTIAIDFSDAGPADSTRVALIPDPDFTLRELHGSAVLRWEYRPGSELFFVWTQTRSGSDHFGSLDASRDMSELFALRPKNVLLVKMSYHWEP